MILQKEKQIKYIQQCPDSNIVYCRGKLKMVNIINYNDKNEKWNNTYEKINKEMYQK